MGHIALHLGHLALQPRHIALHLGHLPLHLAQHFQNFFFVGHCVLLSFPLPPGAITSIYHNDYIRQLEQRLLNRTKFHFPAESFLRPDIRNHDTYQILCSLNTDRQTNRTGALSRNLLAALRWVLRAVPHWERVSALV